jgi:hypothetical protein
MKLVTVMVDTYRLLTKETAFCFLEALSKGVRIQTNSLDAPALLKNLSSAWNASIDQDWSIDDRIAIAELIVKTIDRFYKSSKESRDTEKG